MNNSKVTINQPTGLWQENRQCLQKIVHARQPENLLDYFVSGQRTEVTHYCPDRKKEKIFANVRISKTRLEHSTHFAISTLSS